MAGPPRPVQDQRWLALQESALQAELPLRQDIRRGPWPPRPALQDPAQLPYRLDSQRGPAPRPAHVPYAGPPGFSEEPADPQNHAVPRMPWTPSAGRFRPQQLGVGWRRVRPNALQGQPPTREQQPPLLGTSLDNVRQRLNGQHSHTAEPAGQAGMRGLQLNQHAGPLPGSVLRPDAPPFVPGMPREPLPAGNLSRLLAAAGHPHPMQPPSVPLFNPHTAASLASAAILPPGPAASSSGPHPHERSSPAARRVRPIPERQGRNRQASGTSRRSRSTDSNNPPPGLHAPAARPPPAPAHHQQDKDGTDLAETHLPPGMGVWEHEGGVGPQSDSGQAGIACPPNVLDNVQGGFVPPQQPLASGHAWCNWEATLPR